MHNLLEAGQCFTKNIGTTHIEDVVFHKRPHTTRAKQDIQCASKGAPVLKLARILPTLVVECDGVEPGFLMLRPCVSSAQTSKVMNVVDQHA